MNFMLAIIFSLSISALHAAPAKADVIEDCHSTTAETAINACTDLIDEASGDNQSEIVRYLLLRAVAFIHTKNFTAAEKDATQIIQVNPSSAHAYRLRAVARMGAEDLPAAQSDAGIAVALDAGSAEAYLVQGEILGSMGISAAAVASLATAEGLAGDDKKLLSRIAESKNKYAPKPIEIAASDNSAEITFWNTVKDSENADELQAYLDAYPSGVFVALAKIRLAKFTSAGSNGPDTLFDPPSTGDPLLEACDAQAAHTLNPENPNGVSGVIWSDLDADAGVAACKPAVDAFPDHPRMLFNIGRAYDKQKSYKQAFQAYKKAADQGYHAAMINLSTLFRAGNGTVKDESERVRLLNIAAEEGSARAQQYLGRAYALGSGVEQNDAIASKWYHDSALQGFADAQYLFAQNLRFGWGMKKDIIDAIKWYTKAASQGHTASMLSLSNIFESGDGVPVDNDEFLRWLNMAADSGSAEGQFSLGWYYDSGAGSTEPDAADKALKLYLKSAEQNYGSALASLGVIYEYGSNGVEKDLEKALDYFKSAVAHGNDYVGIFAGELLEQEKELYDPEAAAGYYFTVLAVGQNELLKRSAKDWDKQTARELQSLMKIGGFYDGPLDGSMGPASKEAMRILCKCE